MTSDIVPFVCLVHLGVGGGVREIAEGAAMVGAAMVCLVGFTGMDQ